MQGVVHRPGDSRFVGKDVAAAVAAALADAGCLMVNRNQGSGTRIVIDGLLGGARPDGYCEPAAFAQRRGGGRRARPRGLGRRGRTGGARLRSRLHPPDGGDYDFAFAESARDRPAVAAFLAALADPVVQAEIVALGFTPAPRRSD